MLFVDLKEFWENYDPWPSLINLFSNVESLFNIISTLIIDLSSEYSDNTRVLFTFQTPSKISVSYKNIHGSQTKIEDLETIESKLLENGMAIMKYSLHDCLAKEISLFLHFGSKWIILSEVHFSSETVDAHYIENTLTDEQTEFVKETLKETDLKDSKIMQKEQQQQPEYFSQDDAVVEEKGKEEPNSVVPIANGDSSQMYIGITIGILSMSVLLLLFTIFFMLRKNKHRIFSKHSSE